MLTNLWRSTQNECGVSEVMEGGGRRHLLASITIVTMVKGGNRRKNHQKKSHHEDAPVLISDVNRRLMIDPRVVTSYDVYILRRTTKTKHGSSVPVVMICGHVGGRTPNDQNILAILPTISAKLAPKVFQMSSVWIRFKHLNSVSWFGLVRPEITCLNKGRRRVWNTAFI